MTDITTAGPMNSNRLRLSRLVSAGVALGTNLVEIPTAIGSAFVSVYAEPYHSKSQKAPADIRSDGRDPNW